MTLTVHGTEGAYEVWAHLEDQPATSGFVIGMGPRRHDAIVDAVATLQQLTTALQDVDPRWLIWSVDHDMWWRPFESGYTPHLPEAGRYPRADAERILERANVTGVHELMVLETAWQIRQRRRSDPA